MQNSSFEMDKTTGKPKVLANQANAKASALLVESKDKFMKTAKEWTQKYAS